MYEPDKQGISSALIIKDAIPDLRVSFVKYGTEEHKNFPAEPGQVWCDFSPPKERAAEFVVAGAICLDHHSRDVVEPYGELGIFGENDKLECGAWLAYEHVWLPLYVAARTSPRGVIRNPDTYSSAIRDFATLAAVRDTWAKDDSRWQKACEQAAELVFWGFEGFDSLNTFSLGEFLSPEYNVSPGGGVLAKRLVDKQLSAARTAVSEAHRFQTARGTRVLLFQGVSATSDAAELLERDPSIGFDLGSEYDSRLPFASRKDLEKAVGVDAAASIVHDAARATPIDLVVGFHYRVDAGRLQLQYSTRSHTGFDCAALARAHGGNGHRAAAGFTVEVSPEVGGNPYAVFRLLLEEFEGGQ